MSGQRAVWLSCAIVGLPAPLWAQRPAAYDASVVSQVRIDLRDLGIPPRDAIPAGESEIRALAVAPDGRVYGATSGARSHLFVLDPKHGSVRPLGFLPGARCVHHALVVGAKGDVYIGTALAADNHGEGYDAYEGGHLLKYVAAPDEATAPIRIDAPCPVSDAGIPVKGQGVYATTIDRGRGMLYGLTYPDGHFFSYSVASGEFRTHGRVAERAMPGETIENEKNIGRALALDANGNVFTSGEGGCFYRFSVEPRTLDRLDVRVPAVRGREVYSRVDAWAADVQRRLYGGTSDGYLFRLDPGTLQVDNLGKPLQQRRVRGLVAAPNGKLYGIGGDMSEMARLFSYNPTGGVYEMLGLIDVNRPPHYAWQGFVFDAMEMGSDGTVYLGQAERKSKLFLFYP